MSNELEVTLPLAGVGDIQRPDKDARTGDDALYSEYVRVEEDPGEQSIWLKVKPTVSWMKNRMRFWPSFGKYY